MRTWALVPSLLIAFVASCTSIDLPEYPGNQAAGLTAEQGEYRLVPGDRVAVRYPLYPQWNTELLVRPDGRLSAPLAGEVEVAGHTLGEVLEQLQSALRGRIRGANVELALVTQHKREVYVGGEVVQPGTVTAESARVTLDQALAAAGGLRADTARLDSILIVRIDSAGVRHAWRHDYAATLAGAGLGEPVLLAPGDVVLVPNTAIDQLDTWVEQHISRMIPGGGLLGTALVLRATP